MHLLHYLQPMTRESLVSQNENILTSPFQHHLLSAIGVHQMVWMSNSDGTKHQRCLSKRKELAGADQMCSHQLHASVHTTFQVSLPNNWATVCSHVGSLTASPPLSTPFSGNKRYAQHPQQPLPFHWGHWRYCTRTCRLAKLWTHGVDVGTSEHRIRLLKTEAFDGVPGPLIVVVKSRRQSDASRRYRIATPPL